MLCILLLVKDGVNIGGTAGTFEDIENAIVVLLGKSLYLSTEDKRGHYLVQRCCI